MPEKLLYGAATQADLALAALKHGGERIAFVDGGRRLTYRAMLEATYGYMHSLLSAGVEPGDGVAILAYNRAEIFAASAAVQLVGGCYTPLNPYASQEDVEFILRDAAIRVLFHDAELAERAHLASAGICGLVSLDLPEGTHSAIRPVQRASEDLALISYTGGSTGQPKGVMLSHRAATTMVSMVLAEWEFPETVRLLLCSPLSHAAGAMVLPTLLRGGTVILLPRFDAEAVLDTIDRERVTTLIGVPTMICALLDALGVRHRDVSSLKTIFYGSAPISPHRLAEALDHFGPILMQHYAQTEAPMCVTMLRKDEHTADRLGSCGRPMAGLRVALLDIDGQPVPEGEPGEICVRGPLVMNGYWQRPEETFAALRGSWLHTGDIARSDGESFLTIIDRAKDMIISGGFNVYPREIEDVLARHPAVAQAAVIGVPDEKWGERITAIVVPRQGARPDPEELRATVRAAKGAVQTPKTIEFAETLPLTAVGKVDKPALRKSYWEGRDRMVN